MNYEKIKTEIEKSGKTIGDVCKYLNCSEQGLHKMVRNKSMKIETLENLCRYLHLEISTFWSRNETKVDKSNNKNMDQTVKALQKTIDLLSQEVAFLRDENRQSNEVIRNYLRNMDTSANDA